MHGGAGDDLMNGDPAATSSSATTAPTSCGAAGPRLRRPGRPACNRDRGASDEYVDYLFGGRRLDDRRRRVTGGADILDYRPRPGVDPAAWFEITIRARTTAGGHQHHQGIDWMYGGWDRDVMQGDITANGPNDGDKLIDWVGAYNLYTHCNPAYGGFNDVREHSPSMQSFLQHLAFALGAGPVVGRRQTSGTSGYNELAFVYTPTPSHNSGKAYPTTPGHFESFACEP